jgi:hypothetical protein
MGKLRFPSDFTPAAILPQKFKECWEAMLPFRFYIRGNTAAEI